MPVFSRSDGTSSFFHRSAANSPGPKGEVERFLQDHSVTGRRTGPRRTAPERATAPGQAVTTCRMCRTGSETVNDHLPLMKHFSLLLMLLLTGWVGYAQNHELEQPASVDEVRTQSGVDPTRVTSRLGYSFRFFDRPADAAQINNRISATFVVKDCSVNLKADLISLITLPGRSGFVTGFGGMAFSALNAFFVNDRHALAASLDLAFPFASQNIATATGADGSLTLTPAVTYSYTINRSLMLAIQPQYAFSLATGRGYACTSVLTLRIFLAKFYDSGFYFVFEPRPIYDFQARQFDLVLSPIVGTTLGGGYAVSVLAEVPVRGQMLRSRGAMYLFALTRTF